ncbi:hypothetical protein D3C80_857210 [compost metagenome]
MVEAVAARISPGLLCQDGAVDDVVAEQHHQPLGRPYELFLVRPPTHALGDGQVVEGVFNDSRQQIGRRLADDTLAEAQLGAALVDFAEVHAALLGKTQGGLGWIAFGIESRLQRRAVKVDAAIGLLGVQFADQYGQAPWRGINLLGGVVQPGSLQTFLDAGQEGFGQGVEGFGWQFFGAQFNQKILSTHCAASSLANTSSRSSGDAIGKPSLARACR